MNNPSGPRDVLPLLNNIYSRSLSENERNIKFWEDYLKSLRDLDFTVYSNKLKVPILVPVGNRIVFKGELRHTNEVTVALGADYFVKCSVKQAEVLRQHRIKDAETKLNHYKKEREYLEGKLQFTSENIFAKTGEEIMEPFNEDEDKIWRKQHRENIRKYKQNKPSVDNEVEVKLTDEELWERLEELELKEELENELENMNENEKRINHLKQTVNVNSDKKIDNYNEITPNVDSNNKIVKELTPDKTLDNNESEKTLKRVNFHTNEDSVKKVNYDTNTVTESSEDILQKVLDKQSELEQKLSDLKNRERVASKTEDQLMSRLDELEQLDELEDDIDRLDNILYTNEENQPSLVRRSSVTFADENDEDEETIDITFNHSEVNPDSTPYDPRRGICKPTDVYEAFPQLFKQEIKSILKKTSYDPNMNFGSLSTVLEGDTNAETDLATEVMPIEIKDVQENVDVSESVVETFARPPSLFKLRRQQQKK